MPIGNAHNILPNTKYKVPIIAGNIPPLVIPFFGISLRKDQLITPMPLFKIKKSIRNKIRIMEYATIRAIKNAMRCCILFDWSMRSGNLSIGSVLFPFHRNPLNQKIGYQGDYKKHATQCK